MLGKIGKMGRSSAVVQEISCGDKSRGEGTGFRIQGSGKEKGNSWRQTAFGIDSVAMVTL